MTMNYRHPTHMANSEESYDYVRQLLAEALHSLTTYHEHSALAAAKTAVEGLEGICKQVREEEDDAARRAISV